MTGQDFSLYVFYGAIFNLYYIIFIISLMINSQRRFNYKLIMNGVILIFIAQRVKSEKLKLVCIPTSFQVGYIDVHTLELILMSSKVDLHI